MAPFDVYHIYSVCVCECVCVCVYACVDYLT